MLYSLANAPFYSVKGLSPSASSTSPERETSLLAPPCTGGISQMTSYSPNLIYTFPRNTPGEFICLHPPQGRVSLPLCERGAEIRRQRDQILRQHYLLEEVSGFLLVAHPHPGPLQHIQPHSLPPDFLDRARFGTLTVNGRGVNNYTMEGYLRNVVHIFAGVGAKDPCQDILGKINFRLSRQLCAYSQADPPPRPCPTSADRPPT